MQAENFNLSYHQWLNDAWGGRQSTGLRQDREFVNVYPGKGFDYGRGEAWGLDCTNAAFAVSDPSWRAGKRDWLEYMADVISDGQGACNGFVQATVHNKFVGGRYRARQMIEQSIMENAFRGMVERVFRGNDSGRTTMMTYVLRDTLDASVSGMAWFPGVQAPWSYTGIGPLDPSRPVWCSRSQMPADAHDANTESYQNWSSFAYGYEATGHSKFINFASTQIGGGDLLTRLEAEGLTYIENRAALLALMQRLNGDI
jgi:hypothetical protein